MLILALIGRLLAGPEGMVMALVAGLVLLLLGPRITPRRVMRRSGARAVSRPQAPRLHALMDELSP